MRHISLILVALFLLSCDEQSQNIPNENQFFVDHYSHGAETTIDALDFIVLLQNQFDTLLNEPNQENFEKCQVFWEHSRVAWSQSEIFAVNLVDQSVIDSYNRINSPFRNTLLFENNNQTGIVQDSDSYPSLTSDDLKKLQLNENIYGFHAIEYLLWGLETSSDISQSGTRDWNDLITGDYSSRYQSILKSLVAILIQDLEVLSSHYNEISSGLLNGTLNTLINSKAELRDTLYTNMSLYIEDYILDQRLETLYNTKDISLEESPYSDYSLSDLRFNIIGIESIILGEYIDTEGKISNFQPLADFTEEAETLASNISDIKTTIASIENPLDARISTGDSNADIEKLISQIKSLNQMLK